MITKLIFLLLIAGASDDKGVQEPLDNKANGAQILNMFRDAVPAQMLIFRFLEFIDLFHFIVANREILAKLQQFYESQGFSQEVKIFFDRENSFGFRFLQPVHPYRLPLFLKMKAVPKQKVSLKITRNGPKIENFEVNDTSILIKMDEPFYNIEKPRDIQVAFSFDSGNQRFFLDKVSLPTPFLNGERTASWREMRFEVYFKYVSDRCVAEVTYPCKKGVLPFVIDDESIMFMSQNLNIFQKPKLISNIPNIKKILLLEEIPQYQHRLKMDELRIEIRQKRRKFQNFLQRVVQRVLNFRFHRHFFPTMLVIIISIFFFQDIKQVSTIIMNKFFFLVDNYFL